MLEDHADAPAQRHQAVFFQFAHIHAIHTHLPGAGTLQHVDGPQ